MSYIFSAMLIASLICGFVTGNLDKTVAAAFDGANEAVQILISMAGVMCFWTGFLKITEKSGASFLLAKLLSPLVNWLFKGENEKAKEFIAMNMTANILGMGNAATPMGIKAMAELEKTNKLKEKPSKSMCMLVAMNTASIQLVPTTILSLRAAASSVSPERVIPLIWIASLGGFIAAVTAAKLKKSP